MYPAKALTGNRLAILLCLLPMLGPSLAPADQGVLEINQTCAVNGGCFAGDDPGFPVEIESQGSYVLTSNLDVTVASDPANTTAIEVNDDHVVVDLNGHTILGPASCSSIPVTGCTNSGTGDGIDGRFYTTIKNGSIRGVGDDGILAGPGNRIIGVSLFSNGGSGVAGSDRVAVVEVASDRNGVHGISLDSAGVARDVRVSGNAHMGFNVGGGTVLTNVTAENNGATGIFATDGSKVEASTARKNGNAGILLRDSMVTGNSLFNNAGFGIECDAGSTSAVRGNMFSGNNGTDPEVDGNCPLVADNFCNGSAC